MRNTGSSVLVAAALVGACNSAPALAQAAGAPEAANPQTDIVVTARRRAEALQDVPVIAQVFSSEQLQRQQTVDLKDLTRLAPGLLIGTAQLSIGQQISLRGVGTSSADPGIDQSVSLNIDGLAFGSGLAYSSGVFDLGQVEVLKGPQALFFGKSSPGGVLSLRTADPTAKFEVIARAAYEAEAHTRRGELIVSGPITETIKARLAGMSSKSDGYYYNRATGLPGTGALTPRYGRMNNSENYQLRATVLWAPSDKLDARLKMNYVRDRAINPENFQMTSCPEGAAGPFGIPFINPADNCKVDRTGYIVDMDPAFYAGVINDGVPFVQTRQVYGTLELNYHLMDDMTLTSLTGLYALKSKSLLNTSETGFAGPLLAAANNRFSRSDVTQEFRLNSDFSSPLNFTLGAFYQSGKLKDRIVLTGNSLLIPGAALAPLQDADNRFNIKTYSLYGQLRYAFTPELELAAGARWTDEARRQSPILYPSLTYFPLTQPVRADVPTPRIHSSNIAPEVTLTYKPLPELTLFAAYKRAYKSGSFSIATPPRITNNPTCLIGGAPCTFLDNAFDDEKVNGGEIGIKGRVAGNQLAYSMAAFRYQYNGLQVGSIEPTTGSVPTIRTVNAGSGRVTGAEFDLNLRPNALPGLSLSANGSYTRARFRVLDNAPCYGGQTIAQGCTEQPDPTTGLFFAQNLSGAPFIRAPKWQFNLGAEYPVQLGNDLTLTFSSSGTHSSRYLAALGRRDDFYQSSFWKLDGGVSLRGPENRWEVAVVGKNLTKKYTYSNCSPSNFANGLLGGQVTGGAISGPAGVDEVGCYMDPGRELWVRLTLRPFN